MPEIDISTPEGRRLRAQIARAAQLSQQTPAERVAQTAAARRAQDAKWLTLAGGDPVRAKAIKRAHYLRMAAKSAAARRRNRAELEAFRAAAKSEAS